ncbi:MAG TPA: hypothetical protein H9694_04020 [Firmicutes bacterium]|nr:hypothetical protein [Bacillota bacterium]
MISEKDRSRLRELAKKQRELANAPAMLELKKLWYRHNDGCGGRPMFTIELDTFAQELVTPLLQCTSPEARGLEWQLLLGMYNNEHFHDDKVVLDYFPVGNGAWLKLFNWNDEKIQATDEQGHESIGHQFLHLIHDLEEDYPKIEDSVFGCDAEGARRQVDIVNELFGDILPARIVGDALYACPTQKLVHMMSMETMLFSLYDYPDLFKRLMDRLASDVNAYFDYLEQNRLLLPTVGFEGLGQGTYCATTRLPGYDELEKRPFKTTDVWGFMDSQETVGISPEMYEEFIFPYYKKISDRFGALSYGCCEPVDPLWDRCLSKLTNLRRISISPWCNEEIMGERLAGKPIIYHRKPSAEFIGVGTTLDEEAVRACVRKTMSAAKGCKIEFTQRDVYTVHGDAEKVRRYVEILRDEAAKFPY